VFLKSCDAVEILSASTALVARSCQALLHRLMFLWLFVGAREDSGKVAGWEPSPRSEAQALIALVFIACAALMESGDKFFGSDFSFISFLYEQVLDVIFKHITK